MQKHCINKLLDLKEVKVKNIIHSDSTVNIYIETKANSQICPCCGQTTKLIHDSRNYRCSCLTLEKCRSERNRVKYFVCDMWQPYVDLAHTYFQMQKLL